MTILPPTDLNNFIASTAKACDQQGYPAMLDSMLEGNVDQLINQFVRSPLASFLDCLWPTSDEESSDFIQQFNQEVDLWSRNMPAAMFEPVYQTACGRKRNINIYYLPLLDSVVECFRAWAGICGVCLRLQKSKTKKLDNHPTYSSQCYSITLCCQQQGTSKDTSGTDPFIRRNSCSVRDKCDNVSVIITQPFINSGIKITTFRWCHTHDIPTSICVPSISLPQAVIGDIRKYVSLILDAGMICSFIDHNYGVYPVKKLNNAIEKYRCKRQGNECIDAVVFYEFLSSSPDVAFYCG